MRNRRSMLDEPASGSSMSFWGLLIIIASLAALYYLPLDWAMLRSRYLQLPQMQTLLYTVQDLWLGQNAAPQESVGMTQAPAQVLQAVPLHYVQAAYGHFIFSNNPEQLGAEDLADKDRGNVLLYQAKLSGPVQLYAEHVNKVMLNDEPQPIFFGVQLYNPNDTAVTLAIERLGASQGDWSGASLWRQYLRHQPQEITLQPKGMHWFFSEQEIAYGQVFDAALALDIPLHIEIEINLAAFTKLQKMDGMALPRGMVLRQESDGQQSGRVYSGLARYPLLSSQLSWSIDDSVTTGSFLPLDYAGEVRSSWVTHDNKSADAVREDILAMQLRYEDGERQADSIGLDESGQAYNLANWGVQYAHTFNIENRGAKPRTLRYTVQPAHPSIPKQTLLGWVEGGELQFLHSEGQEAHIPLTLWEVVLQPGETVERTVFVILAAQSYGGVRHALQVVE